EQGPDRERDGVPHGADPTGAVPVSAVLRLADLASVAAARLSPAAWAYYSGGAADEVTLRENDESWARRRLRPRVLAATSADPATEVLGDPVSMPVGVAPTALHGMAHPDGEVATALGA